MHTHVRNELWTYTSGEIGPRTFALNSPVCETSSIERLHSAFLGCRLGVVRTVVRVERSIPDGSSLALATLTVYAVSNRCQDEPINLLREASNRPVTQLTSWKALAKTLNQAHVGTNDGI